MALPLPSVQTCRIFVREDDHTLCELLRAYHTFTVYHQGITEITENESSSRSPPRLCCGRQILPLEESSRYAHFHSPPMNPADFEAKPMVLIVGQYSVGKTSFIRSLLKRDFPGQRVGPEPTTDRHVFMERGDRGRGGHFALERAKSCHWFVDLFAVTDRACDPPCCWCVCSLCLLNHVVADFFASCSCWVLLPLMFGILFHTAPARSPSYGRFVAVTHGEDERVMPGHALAMQADKPFRSLQQVLFCL